MISLLEHILCWVKQFGAMVLSALVDVVNLIVTGFAAALQAVLDNQIPFPALPDVPTHLQTAAAFVAWFFPVATLLQVLATFGTLTLAWTFVAIALRWGKVVE